MKTKEKTVYELLTRRELKVFHLLVITDCTDKLIASRLKISPKTARKHRENIYKKTGQHSINELIGYALKQKFITSKDIFRKYQ